MSISTIQLTRREIEKVLRREYALRAYYRIQGELEESSRIISGLKAKILLASGHSETARHFFELLDRDSKKIDFLAIYQAGKESRAHGEAVRQGLYHCLRALALDQNSFDFEGDFQNTFNRLINLMPDDITAMYPEYLLTEYRATFCGVNRHAEKFFRMGYALRVIKFGAEHPLRRYKMMGQSKYKKQWQCLYRG